MLAGASGCLTDERLEHRHKLAAMLHGEALQFGFSGGCKANEHMPPVNGTLLAAHETLSLGAVDQADHAVLLHLETFGEGGDGGLFSGGNASDGE